jgi:hypothetical protein
MSTRDLVSSNRRVFFCSTHFQASLHTPPLSYTKNAIRPFINKNNLVKCLLERSDQTDPVRDYSSAYPTTEPRPRLG